MLKIFRTDGITLKTAAGPGVLSVDYSRNRHDDSSSLADRSYSGTGIVRYSLTDRSRLSAIVSGYRALDGDSYGSQGYFWNDSILSWAMNDLWDLGDSIMVSSDLRAILPTSRDSRQRDLNLGVRAGIGFSFDLSDYIKGLHISDSLRLRKNFYQYKTAGNVVLSEYQLSNQLSVDYFFAKRFSFNAYLISRKSWSYGGTAFDPDLIHGEELGYQLTDDVDIALGMTNGITYYNPEQGINPIHDLIDLDKMNFYLAVNYQF